MLVSDRNGAAEVEKIHVDEVIELEQRSNGMSERMHTNLTISLRHGYLQIPGDVQTYARMLVMYIYVSVHLRDMCKREKIGSVSALCVRFLKTVDFRKISGQNRNELSLPSLEMEPVVVCKMHKHSVHVFVSFYVQ